MILTRSVTHFEKHVFHHGWFSAGVVKCDAYFEIQIIAVIFCSDPSVLRLFLDSAVNIFRESFPQ